MNAAIGDIWKVPDILLKDNRTITDIVEIKSVNIDSRICLTATDSSFKLNGRGIYNLIAN